jgi:leucyl aminopeptidase (aminopeptidase T)
MSRPDQSRGVIVPTEIYLRRVEALGKLVQANVSAGAEALIVTDSTADPRVWQVLMFFISEAGGEATLALFQPRPADYYDPPGVVAEAMLRSSVNFLFASTGMLHSPASNAAMAAGIPSICMDGNLRLEVLQNGGATADYSEIARLKRHVAEHIVGVDALEFHVTSASGTDIVYSVKGRIFIPPLPTADLNPYRAWRRTEEGRRGSLYAIVFPGGELNIPPVEGTANGVVAIDTSIHHIGRILEPIHIVVRDGWIEDIRGGHEARLLREYLAEFGDDNAYCFPTEASIGLNRRSVVVGNQREDKTVFGSMHFGLGTNVDVGGSIRSKVHMDGVVLSPTVVVDGRLCLDHGQFIDRHSNSSL